MSSKPSSLPHSQLSETFPAVLESGPARASCGKETLLSMGYSDASVPVSAQSLCQIPVPLRNMQAAIPRKFLCAEMIEERTTFDC